MGDIKVSWTIDFEDRASATVHTESIVTDIVRGDYDPNRFAYGTASKVTRNITEWLGSHDSDDRTFTTLVSTDIPLHRFGTHKGLRR